MGVRVRGGEGKGGAGGWGWRKDGREERGKREGGRNKDAVAAVRVFE